VHRGRASTSQKDVKTRLGALFVGAFVMLIVIPAMDVYTATMSGRTPVDYKLWAIFYFVYVLAVLFA
jgi:hypothetical protein